MSNAVSETNVIGEENWYMPWWAILTQGLF